MKKDVYKRQPQMKIEKPVVHISLNPHPEDVLTDIELQNIAREYLEKLLVRVPLPNTFTN